ncbi:mucoidy inhibitor MuiA family protein [Bosea sp. (in: a-proteobacteria)]|uniref:mucoidy inhibitor MuiA family protein n=1 Tax=Bosea sp. (in: a-proteobacteria) TaxID=1871050 RepID=UPI0025C715D5|nr:mucoidy inhibitor MuiA family protein [Bosea sp. (in: a-proteobacteria)]MBR3189337.1 mucoidy inhibitor MuiA family protein [Bosea sp. (in: a-proteobacteria)]
MMKTGLAAALLFAPSLAGAAEIELVSKIDRVTVYPDGAVVTRLGKASLLEGVSQIVLRGLPASVDPASIRVEAQGDGAFSIGAVDVRQVPGEARPALDQVLEGKIRTLQGEKARLAGEIGAIEAKRATIENFGKTGPDKLGPDGKALPIADWPAVFDAIGTALVKVQGELLALRNRIADLDAEIAALEKARPLAPRAGQPKRDVAIAVEAKAPIAADISVSYRVSGASWLPVYEARLTTGNSSGAAEIAFTRRAELRQRTGEDWNEVAVELSTTRSAQGTRAPELNPLRIAFYEPPVVYEERLRARLEAERSAKSQALSAAPAPIAPAPDMADAAPKPAEVQTASVSAGAYQASFKVPGRVTVPQDGSSKAVVLTQTKVKPELSARATPELEEKAYLEASFNHEDEAPLLAGEVYLHRDGAYIGKGRLGQVAPGDKVELGFGADDRLKVTRVPVRRRENDSGWLGSTRTDQREFKTVVKSLHAQPVKLTVTERVPFSENSAITVELLSQSTPPTEKQVGDKRGVSAWSFELAPGAQKEIRLAYRIKYPGDREVVFDQPRR